MSIDGEPIIYGNANLTVPGPSFTGGAKKMNYASFVSHWRKSHPGVSQVEAMKLAKDDYHKMKESGLAAGLDTSIHSMEEPSASYIKDKVYEACVGGYFVGDHAAHSRDALKGWQTRKMKRRKSKKRKGGYVNDRMIAGGPISDLGIPVVSGLASIFGLGKGMKKKHMKKRLEEEWEMMHHLVKAPKVQKKHKKTAKARMRRLEKHLYKLHHM